MGNWSLISMAMWGVGIYVLLRVAMVLIVCHRFLRMVIKPAEHRIIDLEDVPASKRELLQSRVEELEALGFEVSGAVYLRYLLIGLGPGNTGLAMRHTERRDTWAYVFSSIALDPRRPVTTAFATPFGDGLAQTNNEGIEDSPLSFRDEHHVHLDLVSLNQHWRAHESRVRKLVPTPIAVELPELVALHQAEEAAHLQQLVDENAVAGDVGTGFQMRLRTAIRCALNALSGARNRQKKLKSDAVSKEPMTSIPLEERVSAFERMEKLSVGPAPQLFWIWLLLGSSVVFAASMLGLFDAKWVGILTGVIAIHEFGHYAAMKLFRYKDPKIFFIPFFGAATVGEQRGTSVTQEIIVLLAGPMPGILLALVLLYVAPGLDVGIPVFLLAINLLNLLPIYPLDGGRIVHRLLLTRRPMLGVVFQSLSVAVTLWFGFYASEMIVLGFGALMAMALPSSFRMAGMEARLRKQQPAPVDEKGRLRQIFRAHEEHSSGNGVAAHFPNIRQLLDRLASVPVGWGKSTTWLGAYAGCFAVVIVALWRLYPVMFSPDSDYSMLTRDWLALPDGEPWQCGATAEAPLDERRVAVFACTTSESRSEALLDDLTPVGCLRAGWQGRSFEEAGDGHRKARRAIRILGEFMTEGPQEVEESELGALFRQHARENELDEETVELYVSTLTSADTRENEARWQRIMERVGCVDAPAEAGIPSLTLDTAIRDGVFRIAAHIAPGNDPSELGNYLCRAGCQPLFYRLEETP